jgi:drug/metabolite transporter (DMT)-like permease
VDLEEKYAVALGVLSILLWGGGAVLGRSLAKAPPRVIRTVLPIVGLLTLTCFAVFVAVARNHVKG